ncbi:cationic amino acid transporter 9, chloroplastic-like isoform X2 [Cucurbita pepo subsp. pepo]|uniref:cationic amino acid transporter 9, chloroplastic-like isoform X2 n=1 Tax=Cucurbita pepo subsp. pepo TaxID=3664 RepID=UPI000C9D7834|nr:cationic amino acid transporter 9, chloroplastic-like isoform X2 [Cucurbita pepo subsp. pepo]
MGGRNVPTVSSSSSASFFFHFCSSALRIKPSNSPSDVFSNRINSGEGLVRRLGVIDLILIGVGASIGAGIFVITGTVARDTGPGVTISFILAGVSCILNALCYAELATRFPPVVGGAYLYAYTAFNELTAFLVFAQLTLDYHIGIASIARSLAGYTVSFLEIFPIFKDNISNWFGNGNELFGGVVSVNLLAPAFVALLTFILCWGVGEFCAINSIMSSLKVIIVVCVIFVGAFEVDVSNWSPFTPNGFHAVLTGATVVFFAYVGFDAVANSAEESKSPRRDLPIGIIGSLLICIALYVGVCLVITGMVPYYLLGEDAPLAEAFTSKGLNFVSLMISIGAIAGLTTTLLVGLYVQSRMYLGLGRDGLLPSIFSKVHPKYHTPITSQLWVSFVAGLLAGLFNVHSLSRILSVGTLTGYSVVAAGVVTLRWKDKTASPASSSTWREGLICIMVVACSGFGAGLFYRFGSLWVSMVAAVFALLASIALHLRHAWRIMKILKRDL